MTDHDLSTITERVYQTMVGHPPIPDPSVREIAEQMDGLNPSELSGEEIEEWRANLKHIKDNLREFPATSGVHLVTKTYYEKYRETGVSSPEQARKCVCIGELPFGLRIPEAGAADLIRWADIAKNLEAANGKNGSNFGRAIGSAERNEISTNELVSLWNNHIKKFADLVLPVRKELRARGFDPRASLFSKPGGDGAEALPAPTASTSEG